MKRLLFAAAALLCAGCPAVFAQMTPVTATQLKMGGSLIASGSVTFTPVDLVGTPLAVTTSDGAFNAPGPQGFSAAITNGAIATGFAVPDQLTSVAVQTNTPINYQVMVYNSATKSSYTLRIPSSNPVVTGTGFALDHYFPAQTATVSPTGLLSGSVVPARCTSPSKFYTPTVPPVSYSCVGGIFVQDVSGSGGSGVTPVFTIGTVTTGAAGSQAAASVNSSDPAHPVLSLAIPQGIAGANGTTPTFTVGTVTTGAAGSSVAVTITGTAPNYVLNFTIPQGAAGTGGGSSVALKTNGTANGSQSVLNLVAGNNITVTDAGNGNVTVAYATNPAYNGAIYPQQSNTGSDAFQSTCANNGAQIGGATINGVFRPYVCNTAGTRVALDAPSNVGTTGQVRTKQADGTEAWATPAAGSSVALQTNGTANGSQTKLNLVAGSNITLTDAGNGNVTVASTASSSGGGGYTMSFRNGPQYQFYGNGGAAGTTAKFGSAGELATYSTDYALVQAAGTIQSLEIGFWYWTGTTFGASDNATFAVLDNGTSICSGTIAVPQYHPAKVVLTGCASKVLAANDQLAVQVTLPASATASQAQPMYTVNLYAK